MNSAQRDMQLSQQVFFDARQAGGMHRTKLQNVIIACGSICAIVASTAALLVLSYTVMTLAGS